MRSRYVCVFNAQRARNNMLHTVSVFMAVVVWCWWVLLMKLRQTGGAEYHGCDICPDHTRKGHHSVGARAHNCTCDNAIHAQSACNIDHWDHTAAAAAAAVAHERMQIQARPCLFCAAMYVRACIMCGRCRNYTQLLMVNAFRWVLQRMLLLSNLHQHKPVHTHICSSARASRERWLTLCNYVSRRRRQNL